MLENKTIKMIGFEQDFEYFLFGLFVMAKDKNNKKRNLDEWKQIGQGIFKDNRGVEGQLSKIVIDPLYDTSNQNSIYDYRRDTKLPFVRAYDSMVLEPKKQNKNEKKQKDPNTYMNVVTECIPHRLSKAPQLTYPQSLYVLDQSLEGYETAYNKCGPMLVNDNMIGFNREGQAKVWVNENFANNHPSYPLPHLESTTGRDVLDPKNKNLVFIDSDEAAMVDNVVNVVGDHSEEGRWRQPFKSQVQGLNFQQARRLIAHTAARDNIHIPNRIDLIGNRVRGNRTHITTTTTQPHITGQTVRVTQPVITGQSVRVNQPVLTSVPHPVSTTMTTTNVNRSQGFRFNYLPVESPFHPDVFASRVGEHGVYHGHHY